MKTIVIKDKAITQLNFDEWKAQYPEFIAELNSQVTECPECGGDGLCKECGGDGHFGPDKLEIYEKQRRIDLERMQRWLS